MPHLDVGCGKIPKIPSTQRHKLLLMFQVTWWYSMRKRKLYHFIFTVSLCNTNTSCYKEPVPRVLGGTKSAETGWQCCQNAKWWLPKAVMYGELNREKGTWRTKIELQMYQRTSSSECSCERFVGGKAKNKAV